jgi:short-subunit dehydrogenase
MNVFRLDGRRAMITGASKGIGLGIPRDPSNIESRCSKS